VRKQHAKKRAHHAAKPESGASADTMPLALEILGGLAGGLVLLGVSLPLVRRLRGRGFRIRPAKHGAA
jgi:hypothetical protein